MCYEHFQHPSSDAIKRLAQRGVIAAMHPYHAIDDGRWAEKRVGEDRILTTYAFKDIIDSGGILSFGSDWPVAPLSPSQGIYAAVTRRTLDGVNPNGWYPDQKITIEQALNSYTLINAYAGSDEDSLGSLEVDKVADFVVLEDDLRVIDPREIPAVNVWMTVINGRVVYQNRP